MKTVFGGQLDRVLMNEVAIAAGFKMHEAPHLDNIAAQRATDKRYFQMAGTIAALCDQIVTLPYIRLAENIEVDTAIFGTQGHVGAAMKLVPTNAKLDQDAEEALEITKVCAVLVGLTQISEAILDQIDTEDAWIGPYHAMRHLHDEYGQPHTYLASLLLQAELALRSDAVFVLAECDRHILADLGAILVRQRWPRPFPIPDVRHLALPNAQEASGRILNLQPTDLASVDAMGQQPHVRSYAAALSHGIRHAETGNVSTVLRDAHQAAFEAAPSHPDKGADIALLTGWAPIFDNVGTAHPRARSGSDDWSRRSFSSDSLRVVVLS